MLHWLWTWWITVDQPPPTPGDNVGPPKSSDCRNFTLNFQHLKFCTSTLFLQTLGCWCHLKKRLWTIEQQCKSFSPQPRWAASVVALGSGLVWYQECDSYSSLPENVCAWSLLMLWYLPQSTSSEALPSSWVDFLLECYWLLSLLHVHIFLVFYFPWIYFSITQWTEGWNQPFAALSQFTSPYWFCRTTFVASPHPWQWGHKRLTSVFS